MVARRPARLPAHTVDLLTRVMADLHKADELGSARGDLALTLAAMVVNDDFAAGPRVAAAKQLAEILNAIGAATPETGDAVDRIAADRKRTAEMDSTMSASALMASALR